MGGGESAMGDEERDGEESGGGSQALEARSAV